MNVSCACRVRILTSEVARRRIVCVRGRRVCAFTSVRCIDVSCACAAKSLVRAQPSCVRSRACVCSRHVCAFTSVRVQPSCVRVHERTCASTSPVRVRRVRAVTSVMDLRSISGR